jgi:hypothetical protein
LDGSIEATDLILGEIDYRLGKDFELSGGDGLAEVKFKDAWGKARITVRRAPCCKLFSIYSRN